MTYEITKDFHFSYSHILEGLAADHPCGRMHGHNAVVRIELARDALDDVGFVVDYGDLQPVAAWLTKTFDHRHLNDVVKFNPTAELLAEHVYWWCIGQQNWPMHRVGWSETPKTWAWYSR